MNDVALRALRLSKGAGSSAIEGLMPDCTWGCGVELTGRQKAYVSKNCRAREWYRRRHTGELLGKQPCRECRQPFQPTARNQRYCPTPCRAVAHVRSLVGQRKRMRDRKTTSRHVTELEFEVDASVAIAVMRSRRARPRSGILKLTRARLLSVTPAWTRTRIVPV